MVKEAEVIQCFQFGDETNRIVAYGRAALLAIPKPPGSATSIGIAVTLLDPDSKAPLDKTLILQLQPQDAWAISQAIRAHGNQVGWGFSDENPIMIPMGDPKKKN